ncbi:60S ribosomal protein L6 [Asimina triloba]
MCSFTAEYRKIPPILIQYPRLGQHSSFAAAMASLTSSVHACHLKSVFVGETSRIHVSVARVSRKSFLRKTVECKESRIGKRPIEVPPNVTITLEGQDLRVKGPLGELSRTYPSEVKVEREDSGILKVSKTVDTKRANQMHGLFRSLTDNMVVGVSKGFEKQLLLVGVGYRAMVEGKDLVLYLGFSHPVRMAVPEGMQVKVEENTRISVSGHDKGAIGEFAAKIRKWRPPEPYKGKGVRYSDEIVRRKEGKAGKKK